MATAEHRTAGGAEKESQAAAATDPLNDSARKELPRHEVAAHSVDNQLRS